MVGQRRRVAVFGQLLQQRLNELKQVIDLLELAARVLVDAPFARQDVQLLQQLQRLAGAQFELLGGSGSSFGRFGGFGFHQNSRETSAFMPGR